MSWGEFKVRLLRWSETHASGRTVTFRLPEDTLDHPFKGLSTGKHRGQPMKLSLDLLDEGEDLTTIDSPEKPKRLQAAQPGAGGEKTPGPSRQAENEDEEKEDELVRRAKDLCKTIDEHHAAFYYHLKGLYRKVAPLRVTGDWSRDAKDCHDRLCHALGIGSVEELADNQAARGKFLTLEAAFQDSERPRRTI